MTELFIDLKENLDEVTPFDRAVIAAVIAEKEEDDGDQ